jgi:hypothetical protein
MLVGADDGAIDEVQIPIDLPGRIGAALDGGEELVPRPRLRPAPEAGIHRLPGAISVGDIAPGGASGQFPADRVEDAPVVLPRPAGLGWRQERLEPFPFGIRKFVSSGHG